MLGEEAQQIQLGNPYGRLTNNNNNTESIYLKTICIRIYTRSQMDEMQKLRVYVHFGREGKEYVG